MGNQRDNSVAMDVGLDNFSLQKATWDDNGDKVNEENGKNKSSSDDIVIVGGFENNQYEKQEKDDPKNDGIVDFRNTVGDLETRKPVLEKALGPCLFVMQIAGLYGIGGTKRGKFLHYLHIFYMVFVTLLILMNFGINIRLLWYCNTTDEYYMVVNLIIYSLKGVIQTLTLLNSTRNNCIVEFTNHMEEFLKEIKLNNCRAAEAKFTRRSWFHFCLNLTGVLIFAIWMIYSTVNMSSSESNQAENMMGKFFEAMFSDPSGVYVKLVADIYLLTSWIIPASLIVAMINSITYTFEEFYRYVDLLKVQEGGICKKHFLKDIRKKYLRLTEMCGKFDDMSSLMFMFSYLIDIVMVCFLLRLAAFTFTDIPSRMMALAWLCLPAFSLVILSKRASALFDEGQKMRNYIQEFEFEEMQLEDKIELDLLMFHIQGEPVVMTIWKMIPLNRSIIVSIFVSILTYFAMLVSFA